MGDERKIHWQRWEKLTRSKKDGGMGFRDLRAFNLAMLAKQGWRLLHDDSSLVYRCLKARYFPRTHFFYAKESPNCSFVWRSIVAALPILKVGCVLESWEWSFYSGFWKIDGYRIIQHVHLCFHLGRRSERWLWLN